MGRDKAVMPFRGRPMVHWVADALVSAGCASVVAIGGDAAALGEVGLPVVPDLFVGEGPLGAVIAALAAHPDAEAVVVVACDMPLLESSMVAALLSVLRNDSTVDVAMGRTDRLEPLAAAWRPRCRVALAEAFDSGERAIHRAVAGVSCVGVDVPPVSVRNVNTPDDLNG
jgi:molybdopterin-guanine dinucleotide biosynthesis protein A